MSKTLIAAFFIYLPAFNNCFADNSDEYQQVMVTEPFMEMHTGPGAGYPITNVIERGTITSILVQRADWYKVRDAKGKEGWVPFNQISKTQAPNGEPIDFLSITQEDFSQRSWEWGVMGGDFGGAPVFSTYGSYFLNRNFATEASLSQSIGESSSGILFKIGIFMQPFPDWKYSPFLHMGTGFIDVKPSSTLIQPIDRNNQFSNITLGVRMHITQRVIFRIEYNDYVIFSATKDNDDNEDITEWKLGFGVFF